MQKSIKKNINGITLVALVVTVVVLLILAGVSLNLVLGNNGIVSKAKDAKNKTEQDQINTEKALNDLNDWMDKQLGSTTGGDNQLPEDNTTKPYFPSDDFSQLPGTNLDNGLVIQDGEGNQYVWIEVPKTAEVYPTSGINLDINNLTSDNYTTIETDLHTYTTTYRKGTSYKDEYYADSTTGWFASPTEYNTQKYKMLKSVYENGGFWIGRYEAGIENNRTASGVATVTPLSQENQFPYTYVTRTQAKVLAEQVNSGNYTSSLMFGVQWDLVLKYIETKQKATNTNIVSQLNNDSRDIGNYYNSTTFTLNRGQYAKYGALTTWYDYNQDLASCVLEGVKQTATSYTNAVLLTTGASDRNSLQNIYDIAGNVYEWTMEYTSDSNYPCADRGGFYSDGGSFTPASYRYYCNTSGSGNNVGFRVSLY